MCGASTAELVLIYAATLFVRKVRGAHRNDIIGWRKQDRSKRKANVGLPEWNVLLCDVLYVPES